MNLAELIAATKGDRSYAELAMASGDDPGRQRWQQLAANAKPPKNFPDPNTIIGISRALNISPFKVIMASAESLGFEPSVNEPRLISLLPPAIDWLTDQQIDLIRALIVEFLSNDTRSLARDGFAVRQEPTSLELRAARRGPNSGAALRKQQDDEGEASQE